MHSFRSFHVEVQNSIFFTNGSVLREKRAGLSRAETSNIVFVATETLCFGSGRISIGNKGQGVREHVLDFEGTKVMIHHIPYQLVGIHRGRATTCRARMENDS